MYNCFEEPWQSNAKGASKGITPKSIWATCRSRGHSPRMSGVLNSAARKQPMPTINPQPLTPIACSRSPTSTYACRHGQFVYKRIKATHRKVDPEP